jgi:hypothetical protein
MVATATPTNDQLVKALQVGQLKGEKGKELQQQNAFGEILKIVSTNLNQPGESGPYQDQTTYPKETEGQKLKPGDYIDSGDPITDDNMGPDGRPLESRMFDIDPKKHKTQQKQGKIRNLADQGTTEGEKEAAKGKLKDQTDLPNFLQNINIKPQDLLKILQLIPAATGFNLQMANAAGDKMIQGLPRGGYYGNSHRPARESGELTDDKLLETLKIAGPLLMQAQAPANNIRSTWPWRTRMKDDPRYIREFYDPVTGMGINDFKA